MEMYLAMIKRHQINARAAHTIAVIERQLYSAASNPHAKAYHKTNWQRAARMSKKEAAKARFMLLELI